MYMGIARRLAPLVDNSRPQVQLLTTLLLTLPGVPILYYGDEIGMGDNIYLGDRDAVRTPMQWSPDRNGGFSRADAQALHLPVVADPVYGYAAVNVESQQRQEHSLLSWTRRLIAVRNQHPALALGDLVEVHTDNPSVLAYLRTHDDDQTVLCVHNLSRFAQPVRLALGELAGAALTELGGQVPFPPATKDYSLSLAAYGSLLFRCGRQARRLHNGHRLVSVIADDGRSPRGS